MWKINGVFHRDGDLPADIQRDDYGNEEWEAYYKNGKLHRLTGPAVIDYDEEEYWINGKQYTKEEFDEFLKDVDTKDIDMLSDLGQTFE